MIYECGKEPKYRSFICILCEELKEHRINDVMAMGSIFVYLVTKCKSGFDF